METVKYGEGYSAKWAIHYDAKLLTLDDGSIRVYLTKRDKESHTFKEYKPAGNMFHFPKKWGKKKGATILVESRIADTKRIIESAQIQLEKLTDCLNDVNSWEE